MLLVGAMAAPAAAVDGGHVWTRQFGTSQYDQVVAMAVDAGGVYAAGSTQGGLQGANKGSWDGFVRKYDHDGKHLWTRQFGTFAVDGVNGLAATADGVYAAGSTYGSLQGLSKGKYDGFVRKYSSDGKHLWTRQFGTPQDDYVYGVAVDATGVYLAGSTAGSLQGTNKGNHDGFVRKYDHNGKLLWTRQFGTSLYDEALGVAAHAGAVYAAGTTLGSLQGVNKGNVDGFVRKYNADGKYLWTRQFGTPESDGAHGVAADSSGVYAAGTTTGSLQGTSNGVQDGFVRKYSPDGKHLWTRQFGTNMEDYVHGVAVGATEVYAVGQTTGLMQGTYKGSSDGFVRMYGLNGHGTWTRQFGTTTADMAFGVAVNAGGVYVGGRTYGSLKGASKGSWDGFVRKHGTAG